jgi:hypothetical protein
MSFNEINAACIEEGLPTHGDVHSQQALLMQHVALARLARLQTPTVSRLSANSSAVPANSSTASSVTQWLAHYGLEKYGPLVLDKGYDDLIFLTGMPASEESELINGLKMKPPHARAFKSALADLQQSNQDLEPTIINAVELIPAMQPVHAIATLQDNVRRGQSAWLRVPIGPWINRWVPCKVLNQSAGGTGWDVYPEAPYYGSCSSWEQSLVGNSFKNRQLSDLRGNLGPGMDAAPPGRKWAKGEEVACPTCRKLGTVLNDCWFVQCARCQYMYCAADRDGNDVRVQAAKSAKCNKEWSSAGVVILVCLFLYFQMQN